jgi:hypothetical protein
MLVVEAAWARFINSKRALIERRPAVRAAFALPNSFPSEQKSVKVEGLGFTRAP